MAKRPIKRAKTEIDPMFYIPEGVDELVYSDEEIQGVPDEQEDVPADIPDPDVPVILGVVSQTIRKLKSGAHVVDVVIEVEDMPGADKYEIRNAKL